MDTKALQTHGSRIFAAMLPLIFAAGHLSAQTNSPLLLTTTATTVTCSTATGTGSTGTITVRRAAASFTGTGASAVTRIGVTVVAPAGSTGLTVSPSSGTITSANAFAGIVFTVSSAAGCVNLTSGTTTVQFQAATGTATTPPSNTPNLDAPATVTTTLTNTSPLQPSPLTISFSCIYIPASGGNPASYTIPSPTTVSVLSGVSAGSLFSLDPTSKPSWLTVSPGTISAATAGSSVPYTFTVVPSAGCGSLALGQTRSANLKLTSDAPAVDKFISVTLTVVSASIMTVSPVLNPTVPVSSLYPASLVYTKGSGTAGYVDLRVTATSQVFFSVNTGTLPTWLSVDSSTGTSPRNLRFSTTSVCDSLAPGIYTATVYVRVSGYADTAVPVSLQITNKAPRLSVSEGTTRNLTWTLGNALPTAFVTALSTDSPIPYTATTGGTLAPVIAAGQQSGLAYSFGTPLGVSFNPLIFAAASPGSILTGTITLTWGTPAATVVVTFNITVLSPGATLISLSPGSVPTAVAPATFVVSLVGTGFIPGTDPTQRTRVGLVPGGNMSSNILTTTSFASTVVNSSNITLTITVPTAVDANLPFTPGGGGGPIYIGICNPASGVICTTPTALLTLNVGNGPIIQALTSASTFVQVSAPTNPTVAPYDMLSLFGANFCSSGGTGCSTSTLLTGSPDPVTLRYPTTLTPDLAVCPQNVVTNCGATQRLLSSTFFDASGTTVLGVAPVLFATNGQINLMVPAAAGTSGTALVVVNFGSGTPATTATAAGTATLLHSAPFTVNLAPVDPGIFTVGATGQGSGAILNSNYLVIGATNPAGIRTTSTDSDTVQLYVTGLGVPTSVADGTVAGSFRDPQDCVAAVSGTGNYLSLLNAAASTSLTNIDGTIIQNALYGAQELPPCLTSNPTVSIGGAAGTVTYAGFVPNAVAGLYQINVRLPSATGSFTSTTGASVTNIDRPLQLPVVITAGGVTSQSGVSVWVAPRLLVTVPGITNVSLATDTATVGVAYSRTASATESQAGSPTYSFALTSGLLPAGVSLNTFTGVMAGLPAANSAGSYAVTITATDSSTIPVTGSYTYTIVVAGGLYMTTSGVAPFNNALNVYGATRTFTTATATGGATPYTYALTSPPTGVTLVTASNVATVSYGPTLLAGTYSLTVTSSDASATPLNGSITFGVQVFLSIAAPTLVHGDHTAITNITTMSGTGQSGSIAWSLLGEPTGVSINSSTGVISNSTSASAGTFTFSVVATDSAQAAGSTANAAGSRSVTVIID
jgi:uncharacterized protein (TIGR03437 family)